MNVKKLKAKQGDPEPQPRVLFRPPTPFLLTPRMRAPPFSGAAVMPDGTTRFLSLRDEMFRDKYVVLVFFHADFTYVCPTEIIAYSERVQDFAEIGCKILFCSTDSHYAHLAWLSRPVQEGGLGGRIEFPLLSDRSHSISKAYGVLLPDEGCSARANFIIDPKKIVRQVLINDMPVGRNVKETFRSVAAIRTVDSKQGLLPSGWRPADAEDSLDESA